MAVFGIQRSYGVGLLPVRRKLIFQCDARGGVRTNVVGTALFEEALMSWSLCVGRDPPSSAASQGALNPSTKVCTCPILWPYQHLVEGVTANLIGTSPVASLQKKVRTHCHAKGVRANSCNLSIQVHSKRGASNIWRRTQHWHVCIVCHLDRSIIARSQRQENVNVLSLLPCFKLQASPCQATVASIYLFKALFLGNQ